MWGFHAPGGSLRAFDVKLNVPFEVSFAQPARVGASFHLLFDPHTLRMTGRQE